MIETVIPFESDGIRLEGVLRIPNPQGRKVPAVLLIHGSLEHDRDGNMLKARDNRTVPVKNFFIEIAARFGEAGYAVFSWDRRGFGKSCGTPGNYFAQARDAQNALKMMRERPELDPDKIVVFGQSAGVYVATLLAKAGVKPALYILSGGLYRSYKGLMSFNYHRVRDYARASKENLKWVEENDLWGLALGVNMDRMFQAIEDGQDTFTISYKDHSWTQPIDREVYREDLAPSRLFCHINRPSLVIHGGDDMNVPLQDAHDIVKVLKANGIDATLKIIPEADHSFQQIAPDLDTRLRERMSLACFARPYQEEYFNAMLDFMDQKLNQESDSNHAI